jgi:toxin ParE1/3/4
MQIRWSPNAAADLEDIVEYIALDNPIVAQRVARTIYERITALETHPHRGKPGRMKGTRELPLPPLPFIVIYPVLEHADAVEIVNVTHGAQRWPPAD